MASWRKRLARMVADPDPRSYTYEEASGILEHLGFELAKPTSGSHRKFRRAVADPSAPSGKRGVIVGLVQKGAGTLKPKYVLEMVRTLRENNLLPPGVEE